MGGLEEDFAFAWRRTTRIYHQVKRDRMLAIPAVRGGGREALWEAALVF